MATNPDDPRSFSTFLGSINDGQVASELTEKLADLSAAMMRQAESAGGKPKGKIVLSIELQLDRGVFDVQADVTVKMPKTVRGRSIMYGLPNGGLSPNNPRQMSLGLEAPRDVAVTAEQRRVALQ